MKLKLTLILLLLTSMSFGQQLTAKSRGRVFNSDGKCLKTAEVREILSTKPALLDLYDAGRTKKTAGNVLLIGGATCIVADLAVGATQDKQYPSALTFVGAAALIIAIPVKVGYARKIRKAVDGHNGKLAMEPSIRVDDVSICANQNGLGVRLKF